MAPPPENDDVVNDFDIEEEVTEVENRPVTPSYLFIYLFIHSFYFQKFGSVFVKLILSFSKDELLTKKTFRMLQNYYYFVVVVFFLAFYTSKNICFLFIQRGEFGQDSSSGERL